MSFYRVRVALWSYSPMSITLVFLADINSSLFRHLLLRERDHSSSINPV